MPSTSCGMPGMMNHELESILLGKILTISDMQMIPHNGNSEEEQKNLLMRVKEESGKSWSETQQ